MKKFIYTDTNAEVKVGDTVVLLQTYPYETVEGIVTKVSEKRVTVEYKSYNTIYQKHVQLSSSVYNYMLFQSLIKAKAYYVKCRCLSSVEERDNLIVELKRMSFDK